MAIIKDPFVKLEDLPKDAIIKLDPDFEAPGIEWRKCDKHRDLSRDEYFSMHNQPEVGSGLSMKSICDQENDSYVPFETTGLITGTGLTTVLDEPLTLEHDGTDHTIEFAPASASIYFEPCNDFTITDENGEALVTLNMKTGDVEYGENYCLNDAARIFWDALGTYKQPDAWEENENLTATQVLREVRQVLGVGEGESIIDTARALVNNQVTAMSAPGCLDDMPESYFHAQEKLADAIALDAIDDAIIDCPYIPEIFLEKDGKKSWRAKTQDEITFDNAMKVID